MQVACKAVLCGPRLYDLKGFPNKIITSLICLLARFFYGHFPQKLSFTYFGIVPVLPFKLQNYCSFLCVSEVLTDITQNLWTQWTACKWILVVGTVFWDRDSKIFSKVKEYFKIDITLYFITLKFIWRL